MNITHLRYFQVQVLFQCESILFASTDINIALRNYDTKRLFYNLQNLLNAAANISKALWGQKGKYTAQRKDLRDSIGITDDSPLKNVTMRNNFEHFDERLDVWWRDSQRHVCVDFCVMPKSKISGVDPIDWFRVFDSATTDLYFWSEEFNIQKIEVIRILPKLSEEANKPHI